MPYTPEELMDEIKKLQEKQKEKEQEGYCDCHERCPKCGRKYMYPIKPGTITYWNGIKRHE